MLWKSINRQALNSIIMINEILNPWLTFSLLFLLVWLLIFFFLPRVRKEMFWVSFITMPLSFTEPLFVPEYWNPPSLFDLAARTGFDIEADMT